MTIPREQKARRVLACATDVFSRYGYARTTMGEIAAAAGMSRPALYLIFPDKEAVFEAVVQQMDDETHAKIGAGLAKLGGLRDKLLHACQTWGSHGVDLAEAHPDAADLFDLRFPPVRRVYSRFEQFIVELIEPRALASGVDASPQELARVLVFAMRGLRATAANGEEMRRLIAVQVRLLTRALGADR